MNFFDSEKLQAAQKSNLELLQQINGKILKGMEQLSQLPLATLRSASEEGFAATARLMEARDPQALSGALGSFAHPAQQAERLMAFNRQVYDLLASTQADLAKLGEHQAASGARQVQELVDEIARNAPAGAEPAVAAFRSAVETANNVYESAQKTAKQAAEVAESGLAAAASAAGQATKAAAGRK